MFEVPEVKNLGKLERFQLKKEEPQMVSRDLRRIKNLIYHF